MTTPRRPIAIAINILLLTSIYLGLPPAVRADERLSDLRTVFYGGRYAEVLTRLYDYREQPYGKQAEVDYMIGSCLCRTGNKEKAKRRFEWVLSRYRLEFRQRQVVEQALQQCSAGGQARPAYFREATLTSASERIVGVSGKGGTISENEIISNESSATVAVTSETAKVVREIAPEEFESRLFDLSQRDEAIQSVKKLVGPDYQVQSSGPFVLVSNRFAAPAAATTIARVLEEYASFYAREYGIPRPAKFITVYIVSHQYEMQDLATTLHGIRVSPASIGYSFPFDLSMVGIGSNAEFGTLAHELFHLMVRSDFGDIPPWLEEGMAALYEVSAAKDNYIAGLPNWRGSILTRVWSERPTIEQLVKMDWRAFDGIEQQQSGEERQYLRRQAINHATARYVMLYLQEQKKLTAVYKALRNQDIDDLKTTPEAGAIKLLTAVLGKPLADVDKDFARWFSSREVAPNEERRDRNRSRPSLF